MPAALFALAAALAPLAHAQTDSSAATAVASELRRGKILWLQCSACHDLENRPRSSAADGTLGKIGPHLNGVFGRKAGSLKGFTYSDALRKAGISWNAETLDAWLRDPAAVVPGTLMAFPGIPAAADRRALLRYLEDAAR